MTQPTITRDAGGRWRAECVITPPGGRPLRFRASCDEGDVIRALRGDMATAQRLNAESGGFFGKVFKSITKPIRNLGRAARALARGNVNAAIRHGVRSALSATPMGHVPGMTRVQTQMMRRALPVVQNLAPAAAMIPGAGMVASPALMAGTRLLARAYNREPQAVQAISQLRQAASRDPRARARVNQLNGIARMIRFNRGAMMDMQKRRRQLAFLQRRRRALALARARRRRWGSRGAAAGQWVTAKGGQQVFIPAAASGPIWDAVRPQVPYRGPGEALTTRRAYRAGIDILSTL